MNTNGQVAAVAKDGMAREGVRVDANQFSGLSMIPSVMRLPVLQQFVEKMVRLQTQGGWSCLLFLYLGVASSGLVMAVEPPYTDYCAMLERDIAGKQHSFIAGNHMYYIGGAMNTEWGMREHETLGFTHPMFRDGRARGFGIADGPGGSGHDKFGWEFWNLVRAAYGTVIVNGERFAHPEPLKMLWRPDRVTCHYEVAGVKITEVKFIHRDVLCSIIYADKAIEIEFAGQSFVNPNPFPTFDGDVAGQVYSQERTATSRYVEKDNAIHVTEGGTILTKPAWKARAVVGRMMYDGMSVVLSANQALKGRHSLGRDKEGRQTYTFTMSSGPKQPAALVYAMGDDYAEVARRAREVVQAAPKSLQAKTVAFNALLNRQIPFFRCSDDAVVRTYYYLWSLYFMYHTYTGVGYESYPHTQTAINNFMGLHLWDSWAYAAMGTWIVDKAEYAYGNILSWKHMVPFKDQDNALPDNFGTTWHSPGVWMNLVGQVERAWLMYEHSGDRDFIKVAYNDLYRPLYIDGIGLQQSYGSEINALDALIKMAKLLGRDEDIPLWEKRRPRIMEVFELYWEDDEPGYFGIKRDPWKDIWNLSSLQADAMPKEWVDKLCDRWVMNSEDGFLAPVSLQIRPPNDPPNGVFAVSTISTWLAVDGMYRHGRTRDANLLTLNHIQAMNKNYGFPVAPECWDPDGNPWGSMYYNWDGPIVDLLLRHVAGVTVSVPDDRVSFRSALPRGWDYLDVRVPVTREGKTTWHTHRTTRTAVQDNRPRKTYAAVRPMQRQFDQPIEVRVHNIDPLTTLRYSLDGVEPTVKSEVVSGPITISKSCTLTIRAFDEDGNRYQSLAVPFTQAAFAPGREITDIEPGLDLKVFEGQWAYLPEFDELEPVKESVITTISVDDMYNKTDHFAAQMSGYIKVLEDGLYTFQTWSDDGCRVVIENQVVNELDVLCEYDPWRAQGLIGLKAGLHPIRIDYFQAINRKKLEVSYRVGDGAFQPVTGEMLFRNKAQ